ncbi:NADPH-dependent oxidoreductase [Aureimonas leprariae]|uniref:NADPH-dependent oxidoreductase n=2 Tax=Plantimonas leprariae TaxID=2615207 RepID=A0A7V7PM50_9HYPH|nr:NADPH-dependent oxidoreductase [Aureimonas leprariae]
MEAAWRARYGAAAPAAMPWNETIAGLLAHRSVRAYRGDPLAPGTLEALAAAAQSAPTSSNMQAWSLVAVTEAATKRELARLAAGQKHIEECPLFLVFLADLSRAERLAGREGVRLENLAYLETFLVAAFDAAFAAENALVAAESLGLSTVYIGALRNRPEAVAALLGLPGNSVALFGLCVGHADEPRVPNGVRPRLPQAAVVHCERYDAAKEADLVAAYDRTFAASPNGGPRGWTARVCDRFGPLAALAGRETLKGTLRRLGFPLA